MVQIGVLYPGDEPGCEILWYVLLLQNDDVKECIRALSYIGFEHDDAET